MGKAPDRLVAMVRAFALMLALAVVSPAAAADAESDPVLSAVAFHQALQSGDSTAVDSLVSDQALVNVRVMLDALKQSIRADQGAAGARLASAGYTTDVREVLDWDARDYLRHTVALPVMQARYLPYEMEVISSEVDGDEAVLGLVFSTSTGFSMESAALLEFDDGVWKVTSFMGLNSFP